MHGIKTGFLAAAAALAVALPGAAAAQVFKPTGATASSQHSGNYAPIYTIDGSGLPSPTDISAPHATYAGDNHWTAASGQLTNAWIDWTFTTPQTIGAAYIWNHRSDGVANNPGYDVTLFDLTFFDSLGAVLFTINDHALAPDTAFAQRIDFLQVSNVSRVRFDIEAVQSSPNWTGLAEVAFDTQSYIAAVPEPGTWAMMIGGFGLMGGMLRRKRTATPAVAA